MKFTTASESIYEVDEEKMMIRRLDSKIFSLRGSFVLQKGQWYPYALLFMNEVATVYFGKETLQIMTTNKIVSIER